VIGDGRVVDGEAHAKRATSELLASIGSLTHLTGSRAALAAPVAQRARLLRPLGESCAPEACRLMGCVWAADAIQGTYCFVTLPGWHGKLGGLLLAGMQTRGSRDR
jgi:hypothetical protein